MEAYKDKSNVPVVLFKFPDSERLKGFLSLATMQSCTAGHRAKGGANECNEPIVPLPREIQISHVTEQKVLNQEASGTLLAELYPVDGLTKSANH